MTSSLTRALPFANVPVIPYWEHMFPGAIGGGLSATQKYLSAEFAHSRVDPVTQQVIWSPIVQGNETAALYDLDLGFSR